MFDRKELEPEVRRVRRLERAVPVVERVERAPRPVVREADELVHALAVARGAAHDGDRVPRIHVAEVDGARAHVGGAVVGARHGPRSFVTWSKRRSSRAPAQE